MIKEVLGWMVDGSTRCIELARDKKGLIGEKLHKILRMTKGGEFKRIEKLIGKIRYAATAVTTRKQLTMPINKILQVKPQIVQWKDFLDAKQAFRYWRTMLKEAAHELTAVK